MKIRFIIVLVCLVPVISAPKLGSGQVETDVNTILFLGASNTVEELTSVNRNGSFVTELRTLNPTWNSSEIVDRGVSGRSASNFFGEIDLLNSSVFDVQPEFVVIILGGNDFLRLLTPDKFRERYEWILDALLFLDKENVIEQIFVANIYWGRIELETQRVADFEKYQEVIANSSLKYDFPLLDFFGITENHPEYFVDNIHLNDLGHRAISTEVNRVIAPYLNGSVSRQSSYPVVSEIYSNSYIQNSPGFVALFTILSISIMTIIYKKYRMRLS